MTPQEKLAAARELAKAYDAMNTPERFDFRLSYQGIGPDEIVKTLTVNLCGSFGTDAQIPDELMHRLFMQALNDNMSSLTSSVQQYLQSMINEHLTDAQSDILALGGEISDIAGLAGIQEN